MGVMKPECRKFLRDNRFATVIDGFVEKDVLTLIDLVDFCAGKRAIKQIESMGIDIASATKLVELVRRNAVKWKKAENMNAMSFAQPKPLRKDTLAFLTENKLEMFEDALSKRGISTMMELKQACTKTTSLDDLIDMGMKRMQARNLINIVSKKKVQETSTDDDDDEPQVVPKEEEVKEEKKSSKEYAKIAKQKQAEEAAALKKEKAQKIADAKAAKLAASAAAVDEWKRIVNERVAEDNRYTGILEVVTGVGFFGRDIRQPRYALYDRASNVLELFPELGPLDDSLVVEVGSAIDGGAAGPLRRRFLLQVNATKQQQTEQEQGPVEMIFHVYTPKEAAAWALVFNDGEKEKSPSQDKKSTAPAAAVAAVGDKATKDKKSNEKSADKSPPKKESRASAAELAERAAERKLAAEKRKQAKAEEAKQKAEKAEAKELMKKKKAGVLNKEDKKRLKELKHIKRSKSFEGVPEDFDDEPTPPADAPAALAAASDEVVEGQEDKEGVMQYDKGERVFALYKGDGHWYAAVVTAIRANEDGEVVYDVDYEGFSDEDKVDLGLTIEEIAPVSDFEEEGGEEEEEEEEGEGQEEPPSQEEETTPQEESPQEEEAALAEEEETQPEETAEAGDAVPDTPVEAAAAPVVEMPKEDSISALFKKQLEESTDSTTDSNSTSGNTNISAKEAKKLEKEEKKRRKTELKIQQKEEKNREKAEKLAAIERAKQEKLDAIQRAKEEKEREKQEKLDAIERAKQEKLDAIQRAKEEKEREKQEKLYAIARAKQEKIEAAENAKQEKINAKRRATQLKQEEAQAKIEAKEREKARIAEEKAEKARLKKEASMRK